MANVITSKSYVTPFMKELDKIYDITMMEHQSEFDKVCKIGNAPSGPYMSQGEMSGIGLPGVIPEGAGVNYSSPVEGNIVRRDYFWSGLGYVITKQALDDELFGQLRALPAALAKGMRIYADIQALELYNTMEASTTYGKDGVAICNAAGHTVLNDVLNVGAQYNIPATSGDLSETTFKEALEYYDNVVDENSYPLRLDPSMLICSIEDKYVAHRLHTQMYGGSTDGAGLEAQLTTSGSEENAHMLNLANPQNGFVGGWTPFASRFMESDRWFLNAKDHDVNFMWKQKPMQESENDFDTGNTKFKSTQRFTVFENEWRGTFGNIDGNTRT